MRNPFATRVARESRVLGTEMYVPSASRLVDDAVSQRLMERIAQTRASMRRRIDDAPEKEEDAA